MRRFAENTSVMVSKSRGHIDQLLREWGADGLAWHDDFNNGIVTLRFLWSREETKYAARISLHVPTREEITKLSTDGRTGTFSQTKFRRFTADVGKREHRLLLLWLKAMFNAIDQGLVSAETIFLPFFEDKHGRTVAEVALPRLGALNTGSALRLLPAPMKED